MKRNRLSTILNIIGMSLSLMVFLVLFAQVWFDYKFNRNFDDYENIYRLEEPISYDASDYTYDQATLRPLIEAFESCSPDVLVACDYEDYDSGLGQKVIFNDKGDIKKYDLPRAMADSSLPDVFSLKFVAGSAKDFSQENDAIISGNCAEMIFGNDNPIGKTVMLEMTGETYKIVGVYETLPENCSIVNGLIICEGDLDLTIPNHDVHVGFFRLKDGAEVNKILDDFKKAYSSVAQGPAPNIRLTPITDTHFLSDTPPGAKPSANMTQVIILLSIAFLFLLIAIFNYINFSMASIPFKINDINIERVFGATRKRLILNQLKNGIIITIVSFVLALALMEIVADSEFAAFSCCSLAIRDNLAAILICFVIGLSAAVIGGLVTAIYSTSFAPGVVLKGTFAISGKGIVFRKISLIAQYVLSCVFLICGLMISRQTNYMLEKDNGFKTENIIHAKSNLWYRWHECFDELLKNPEIIDVTCGDSPMDAGLSSRSELMSKDNTPVWYSIRHGYYNYFDFFGFTLVEGRFPREGEFEVAIVNQTFAETYPDYQVGSKMRSMYRQEYEIIGVVKDFNARPLMHKTEPMVYFMNNKNFGDIFFKSKSNNVPETTKWVEKAMRGLINSLGSDGSQIAITTTFLDDDIENMYRKELGQSKLITSSSILCLLIALLGVLGIVYFETRVMKKEIAIRKVNGATTEEIIKGLSKKYIATCTVGFIIAVPISFMILNWWLGGFAYRTDIPVRIFILSYLIIALLTAATVIIRSYSAASDNPVDALKME